MTQPEREDVRAHLSMIQTIITRMSTASSNAKSWLLPVVTATYGFAMTKPSWKIGLLGIVAVLLFAFIDANYLRQERAYRELYNRVASGDERVPLFSLNPSDANDQILTVDDDIPSNAGWKQRLKVCVDRWIPPWKVWRSWSITPFYGAFLLVGIGVVCTSR